jgi:hypothetical protein
MIPALQSLRSLLGRKVRALDCAFGELHNVYIREENWTVAYFVVQTGSWLEDRRVLVSPAALRTPFWMDELVHVDLTKREIEESPPIDLAKPVSRQQEELMNAYFGWPGYWRPAKDGVEEVLGEEGNSELRSLREMIGYSLVGQDTGAGGIVDFVAEEPEWPVLYLAVETGPVLSRKRFVPVTLISGVDWATKTITAACSRNLVLESPEPTSVEFPDSAFRALVDLYYSAGEERENP